MKTCVKNTALCTIAFLLFLFGNSVNVIHFCCDVCRVQGTNVFTEDICHEKLGVGVFLSNSNSSNPEIIDVENGCSVQGIHSPFHLTHQHEVCSLSRITIILDVIQKNLNNRHSVQKAFLYSDFFLKAFSLKTISSITYPLYNRAISLAGRILLNKICVLRN